MSVVDDLLSRADRAAQDRSGWEDIWHQIQDLVLPTEPLLFSGGTFVSAGRGAATQTAAGPRTRSRVRAIYDNTGMWACDRLAAGVESLVTPQSEKWHGLTATDPIRSEPSDEEKEWLDKLRNYLFTVRYDPRSGFIAALQKAMRACVALGTGVIYIEESLGRKNVDPRYVPMIYRYMPLVECMLGTDDCGNVDSNFRFTSFSARQLAQKFGREKLSPVVQQMLDDPARLETQVECLHAVCPREEAGTAELEGTIRNSRFASYYVERSTKHLISNSGFYEFPYAVFHWLQQDNGPYGESAVMLALSEIKGLQAMGKAELRAFQQWTDPPLATPADGIFNRPNLNPRAVNPGAMGPDGKLRVAPIITATQPQFSEQVMEVRRNSVKETLYVNLFQILIRNPNMTATEAMIRANEKGELLGPAGGKIQAGLAVMIDRELGVLERKGIYLPSSQLRPVASLAGKQVIPRFTSPLDRLRRSNELIGMQRVVDFAIPIAKVKADILLNFDFDTMLRHARDISGAPVDMLVTLEELAALKKQAARMQKGQAALSMAQAGADAAKSGSIAARNLGETSMMSPEIMSNLNDLLKRLKVAAEGGAARGQVNDNAMSSLNRMLSQFGEAPAESAGKQVPGVAA